MMLKFVVLACLATVSMANFNVKFNQALDSQLDMVNAALAHVKMHTIPLGDKTVNGAQIKGMSIGDVATLERIGDASMRAIDDSSLQVFTTIGLKNMVYGVQSYTSPKISYTNAKFNIKTNSLTWVYTAKFTPDGGCSIDFQEISIGQLADVTMYSDDPKMNGIDVSPEFEQVRQSINQYFTTPEFQNVIAQYDFCKGNTAAWSKVFSALA